MTVHNTKSGAIDNLRVVDQVPVSEEGSIQVRLVNPAGLSSELTTGGAGGTSGSSSSSAKNTNKLGVRVPPPVPVSSGVVAHWAGIDEINSEENLESLGKDGKINWVCSVPSQGKVGITLQWEVVAPLSSVDIVGF